MSIDNILPLLNGVKPKGNGQWMACCPVHNDDTASLAIKLTDNGKVLIRCFGCACGIDEFCQSLGISINELFPEKPTVFGTDKRRKREYFSADMLLDMALRETSVITMCAIDIISGKPLSTDDMARLIKAKTRLDLVQSYVHKNT